MTPTNVPENFYTFEGRLASFQSTAKRRASNAKGKASKSVKWPHKFLSAEELASAGFFYQPSSEGNDNVTCFLCLKSILGWEKGDAPLAEHLKLSPDCGWAIVSSIEANDETLAKEDPASERMVKARSATFADKWPHEHKKGWKCKTKQLVDAGWIYKPSPEYDDMAMCSYCNLGLDGWEPKDDPMEQHYKRNPDCTFFNLINQYQEEASKKKPKGRKPRASKASRLSTQSVVTTQSEAPSFLDLPAEADDSILTTATNTTVTSQGGQKMPKASRKLGSKKPRAKKSEAIDVAQPEDDDFEVKIEQSKKAPRGNKRTSQTLEDPFDLVVASAPPAKRRTTRTRSSIAMADSVSKTSKNTIDAEISMEAPAEIKAEVPSRSRKGRISKTKSSRSVSAASQASLQLQALNDNELDDALLADLDRPLSDEDNEAANSVRDTKPSQTSNTNLQESPSVVSVAPASKKRVSKVAKASHAMFGPQDIDVDDAAIEAELDRMQMQQSQPLPKAKGAKVRQPRKASAKQQAAAKRAAEAAKAEEAKAHAEAEPIDEESKVAEKEEPEVLTSPPRPLKNRKGRTQKAKAPRLRTSEATMDESHLSSTGDPAETMDAATDLGNESEASVASDSTIIRRENVAKKSKADKKAPSKKTKLAAHISNQDTGIMEVAPSATVQEPPRSEVEAKDVAADRGNVTPIIVPEAGEPTITAINELTPTSLSEKASPIGTRRSMDLPSAGAVASATLAPVEATRSVSPQSSDAENRPPSSKPSTAKSAHTTSRIPAAAGTPTASPSKRNVIAGLQSSLPWSAVDLDEVFMKSPVSDKENARNVTSMLEDAINKAKKGELTSPEKGMTVEQWINFNAGLSEERLKGECERMVSIFEREGGRAMRVLEEVGCLD